MKQSRDNSDSEVNPELADTISSGPKGPSVSRTIGPFRLLQKIGEGGMGSVFVAEQTDPVRRKVAVKVIKSDVGNKDVLARFEAERQALALMTHPNIARILDAGTTEDGEPFFVMEFVNGKPIIQHCNEFKLNFRDRIALFRDVCNAIHHAHQKGIIHRDIKSSNVLVETVDECHVVKVIDFGLAKAVGQPLTEKTLFTRLGQVVGTLEYMSPEQANLNSQDIDTRTDIYSLGVLLYELITGTTPLERTRIKKTALDQILRLIREEEAELPSSRLSKITSISGTALQGQAPFDQGTPTSGQTGLAVSPKESRFLKGELDWIVMKTLEKDRSRRYDSASALSSDLNNFLHGEVVVARPPSFSYRLSKSIAKNRVFYVAGALILAALLAGIAGTSVGMYRAVKAENTTRRQFSEIEKQKREIDSQFLKLKETNERANRHVVEIRDILEKFGDSAHEEALSQNSTLNNFREQTFQTVVDHFRQLSEEYPEEQELKFELGNAYYGLAYFYRSVDKAKKSSANYVNAIQTFEQLMASDSGNEGVATQLGMAYQNYASLVAMRGADNSAELTKARNIWRDLATKHPDEFRFQRNKLMLRSQVALQEYFKGNLEQAIELEKENEQDLTALQQSHPNEREIGFLLSSIKGRLANMEIDRKNFDAAQTHVASCYELAKSVADSRKDLESEINLIGILNTWSIAIKGLGDQGAALAKREEALELARTLHRNNPESTAIKHSLALVLNNLAYDYGTMEKLELARKSINECVVLREELAANSENALYRAEFAKSLTLSALFEYDFGDQSVAQERCREGVKILQQVSVQLPHVGTVATWLAEAEEIQRKIEEASID